MSSHRFSRHVLRIDLASISRLEGLVRSVYFGARLGELSFHGWPHISFVRSKAIEFASRMGANVNLVSVSALVHDLNYVAKRDSEPRDGRVLRRSLMGQAGLEIGVVEQVEIIVEEAHLGSRVPNPSAEGASLSDADTLFKVLPITPVALADRFRRESGLTVREQAAKIVREQVPLLAKGIFFYQENLDQKYGKWARTNIELWSHVAECLEDEDVLVLLKSLGLE